MCRVIGRSYPNKTHLRVAFHFSLTYEVNNFLLSIFSEILRDFSSLSNVWVLVGLDLPMTLHIYGRVYIIFSNYNVE